VRGSIDIDDQRILDCLAKAIFELYREGIRVHGISIDEVNFEKLKISYHKENLILIAPYGAVRINPS